MSEHVFELEQISVFLENRPGMLATATRALSEAGVNLRALMIAETERFGIMRIIANDNAVALKALAAHNFTTRVTPVVGVEVPDRVGGLSELLDVFTGSDISVEYMYAELSGGADRALLIMKLEPREAALAMLRSSGLY